MGKERGEGRGRKEGREKRKWRRVRLESEKNKRASENVPSTDADSLSESAVTLRSSQLREKFRFGRRHVVFRCELSQFVHEGDLLGCVVSDGGFVDEDRSVLTGEDESFGGFGVSGVAASEMKKQEVGVWA